MAAIAILAVFIGMGLITDDGTFGWVFGTWVVIGSGMAAALVRPIGLWVVVPAPPLALLIVVAIGTAWQLKPVWSNTKQLVAEFAPPYLHGFPWLAAAIGVGIGIAVFRLTRRARSSSGGETHAGRRKAGLRIDKQDT
ncbi:hypothetical protein LWC34_42695 [Kibdelosporangium philippinense]|uniref:DUF6542 domain-containing protein n=1 Tax=Kibdelosporangium philippinense TaxID=211113 RepID=A0ABS8ZS93_9PSEU|nr:DUF6542 domain-containing protein [Kibdelosporangium philippinense]MCE7009476.1 hypothetical protein [Kibdelosporangium philippinense]